VKLGAQGERREKELAGESALRYAKKIEKKREKELGGEVGSKVCKKIKIKITRERRSSRRSRLSGMLVF